MKQAAIITIWFGKLPSYFPLWVRSLKTNKQFDFLLFTDQIVSVSDLPENLKVFNTTFEGLKALISEKLQLKAAANFPYKLCDFRPAYGEIFNDHLEAYNFWGHCDIDLMFGNLSNFITPEILLMHKKILNRGHLSLFRNEPAINQLYRSSHKINYKQIFESAEYYMFDEWHGIHKIFKEYNIEQYHRECIADIKANAARFICTNIENYKKQLFVWESGTIKQYYIENTDVRSRELAYIHFQKRKIAFSDQKLLSSPSIIFNPHGFTPFSDEITAEVIKKFDVPNYNHYLKRQSDRVLKKLHLAPKGPVTFNQSLKNMSLSA